MMYIYSSFYESSQSGIPVARSLAIEYTFDDRVYSPHYQHEYFFGPSILVVPIESYKEFTRVWLPGDDLWYNLFTDITLESGESVWNTPIEELPLFVKASSIIPVCPKIGRNTGELGDTIEYHIYAGKRKVSYTLYEDDGETYNFTRGSYNKRIIIYDPLKREITISEPEGGFNSRFTKIVLCLHGFDEIVYSVNKLNKKVTKSDYTFILPISNFDPFMKDTDKRLRIKGLKKLELDNNNLETKITW